MAEDSQNTNQEEPRSGSPDESEIAHDEDGQALAPPYFLVSDIAKRKLLPTANGKGAISERRIQEMIKAGTLPAFKATFEQEISLLKNGRVRRITDKGVWLVAPAALLYAGQNRKRVGFPRGQNRPKRGTKTGVGDRIRG